MPIGMKLVNQLKLEIDGKIPNTLKSFAQEVSQFWVGLTGVVGLRGWEVEYNAVDNGSSIIWSNA